ncbi:type II CRISPR-associated endonuclease Cas1 [Oceanivirga salmonicida]|uniref:type II CRISPR-associated endonuclease Cas1 n=1 Tax=Oceanivirga salmonicida TaxID=1769291 RepID=UPI000829AB40|nr:type II CRISPR-associated endonuclease Cas1 [Oceanivirga salmonicida]
MGWRTVVIGNRSKLDLKYNNVIIRKQDEVYCLNITELDTLILESTAISVTCALLCELVKNKVKIIFCDEKSDPFFEISSLYGSHDTYTKINQQFNWKQSTKESIWTRLVYEKIGKQKDFLKFLNKSEYKLLEKYQMELEYNDITNREAHAAKVYFNALFGKNFSRREENAINKALNYGYHLLTSTISKEIINNGYLTQLGIFHSNQFNKFNLTSDLVEVFRPLIDKIVYNNNFKKFGSEEKKIMLSIFKNKVKIDNKEYYVPDAIKIYVKTILDAINSNELLKVKIYNEL